MNRLIAPIVAVAMASSSVAQTDHYRISFNVSRNLSNVFVSAHEWNGEVYAWDLFPAALGTVPAGTSTFDLGTHNVVSWAVFATEGTSNVAAGINDSINPPDGLPFATVFPGYALSTVRGNIATLNIGGAYNVPQAYSLFDFVLTNEDTLKTDLAAGMLHVYTFDNAVVMGTATISPMPPCPGDLTGDRSVGLADLAILLAHFGTPSGATSASGDLDGDGDVDLADLAALLSLFGTNCP